jgi:hypothetical protein
MMDKNDILEAERIVLEYRAIEAYIRAECKLFDIETAKCRKVMFDKENEELYQKRFSYCRKVANLLKVLHGLSNRNMNDAEILNRKLSNEVFDNLL